MANAGENNQNLSTSLRKQCYGKIRSIGHAGGTHLGQMRMKNIQNGIDVLPRNNTFLLLDSNI